MELNYIISIIDRKKMKTISKMYDEVGIQLEHSSLCHGSTKSELIDKYGIEATDKGIVYGTGNSEATKDYIKKANEQLMIDVPGNGLIVTIPIKSVKGGRTMAYMANNHLPKNHLSKMREKRIPKFDYEMIVIILNEGYTDMVMEAARSAGASGGTVLHAKGTGSKNAEQFFGVSLANEREIIYIVAEKKIKTDIMNNIDQKCGVNTEVGAICFSLPVTNAIGIRHWIKQ